MADTKEHIVMFPFMAQGHIIPYLALGHLQQQPGVVESVAWGGCWVCKSAWGGLGFVDSVGLGLCGGGLGLCRGLGWLNRWLGVVVGSPENLKSSLPPNSSIRLLEIPFSSSNHGLPLDTENTNILPYHLIINLIEASTSLKPSFKKLIESLIEQGNPPLCIISDIFFGWTASIAKELNVFHAIFTVSSAYGLACYYSLWMNMPHRKENNDSDEFSLPDFEEASKVHISQRKLGRPAWPIGPILLSMESREPALSPEPCIEWLNTKPLKSVLYVSFGSQNTISASQMMQLAMGLEASDKNFIWVIRPPIGFEINSEFKAKEWLPKGFEARIKDSGRGLLVYNWAPQVEILSHKAVSAFLTHCGWNSVLEALSHAVLLIGWPLAAEQFFNAKLLEEEVGVCVEVARGKTCEVRHEEIAAKIELVMNETQKGEEMRRKACEAREMIRNAIKDEEGFKGSSVKAMDEFFSAALSMKEKTKKEQNVAA
uniref:Glycosyltransferase n=1 Tax=Fagus sylvatica TaxID=28930 RepID=A0A2N9HUS6_FAGSY